MTYHGIKWQKKPSGDLEKRTRRKDRKKKAGTKTSNGVGRCRERREREREGERNETHFCSSRKYKLAMCIFDSLGYTYCSTKQ